ncbi:MAG: hypothetical protein KBD78_09245, partial [Oligoflexales bacterium]|nr:hypothetical protein [Oligoflexales bacterium]
MALNALYSLPALDTQYGLMFYGSLMEGKFQYYLASFNGNAKASANTNENNGTKEFVAKVVYAPVKTFNFGLGFDTSSELDQTLAVNDLVGGNFATVAVSGRRQGFSPDVYFVSGDFSTRFELMQMRWDDKDVTLQGGYWQGAYFISGNEQAGLQALLRLETVKLDVSDASNNADQLNAATTGLQWFINANLRNQFNLIASQANEDGGMGVYAEKGTRYAVLNELQLKF